MVSINFLSTTNQHKEYIYVCIHIFKSKLWLVYFDWWVKLYCSVSASCKIVVLSINPIPHSPLVVGKQYKDLTGPWVEKVYEPLE